MESIVCGIDVSKAKLDCRIMPGEIAGSFDNSAEGIAELAAFCATHNVALAVMEATGGYERLAFLLLWQHGIPCAIVNARSVRRFAEAMGYLEKTDGIDAAVIARFATAKGVKPMPPPSGAQQRLTALTPRLRQVTGDIAVNTLRRNSAAHADALASLGEVVALLRRQSKSLEGEIMSMIDDDPLWKALAETFGVIKGVANRTIARLMAELPEIGVYDNKAIAKLAGLAPIANDSGKSHGPRQVRGGRSSIRSILYTVGYIVAKHQPEMKIFAERLKAAGKPAMVVRIAVARKLLVWLNAKARDTRKSLKLAT